MHAKFRNFSSLDCGFASENEQKPYQKRVKICTFFLLRDFFFRGPKVFFRRKKKYPSQKKSTLMVNIAVTYAVLSKKQVWRTPTIVTTNLSPQNVSHHEEV